jgi:hypothetical protein
MRLTFFQRASLFFVAVVAGVSSGGLIEACGRTDLGAELETVGPFQDSGIPDSTPTGDSSFFDGPSDDGFCPDCDGSFFDGNFEDVTCFGCDGSFDSPFEDGGFCGDGQCNDGETCSTCPNDCGQCSSCGDGRCDDGETCNSCPEDCGICSTCGNGSCDPDETCGSCPEDCGSCNTCGDGFCNHGETCISCPGDCGVCSSCGDGTCNPMTENCTDCPADCGKCMGCGDGICEDGETCVSCAQDCGPCAVCGNNKCETPYETCTNCPGDCGACTLNDCEEILTCAFGCVQGGIDNLMLSCITNCDADSCPKAQMFADDAVDCIIQNLGNCGGGIGMGGGVDFNCLASACPGQFAACLGSSCN